MNVQEGEPQADNAAWGFLSEPVDVTVADATGNPIILSVRSIQELFAKMATKGYTQLPGRIDNATESQ